MAVLMVTRCFSLFSAVSTRIEAFDEVAGDLVVVFAGYDVFFHHFQMASYDLTAMWRLK